LNIVGLQAPQCKTKLKQNTVSQVTKYRRMRKITICSTIPS